MSRRRIECCLGFLVLAIVVVGAGRSTCTASDATEVSASLPSALVVLAALEGTTGTDFVLVPFLTYSAGRYTPLADGINSAILDNLRDADMLPSGEGDPRSPTVSEAVRESVLNNVKSFEVYRSGKKVGSFSVNAVRVMYVATPTGKVVGVGVASGFVPQVGDVAVSGPASHSGFWSAGPLTAAERDALRARARALLPKTVPPNPIMPQAVGQPIVVGKTDDEVSVFDLGRDGNTEGFIRLHAELRLASGTILPDGYAEILASYSRSQRQWIPLLSSVYSGGGESLFGQGDYELLDVLDIDADGHAEVVLSRGSGEVSDLEVYQFKGNRLFQVCKISGWTGS